MEVLLEKDERILKYINNRYANYAIKDSFAYKDQQQRVAQVIKDNFVFCVTDEYGNHVVLAYIEDSANSDDLACFLKLYKKNKGVLGEEKNKFYRKRVREKLRDAFQNTYQPEMARQLDESRSPSPRRTFYMR